jgi:hypothetical protein
MPAWQLLLGGHTLAWAKRRFVGELSAQEFRKGLDREFIRMIREMCAKIVISRSEHLTEPQVKLAKRR